MIIRKFYIALIVLGVLVGCRERPVLAQPQVCIAEVCFDVEIAQNEEQRMLGLQFREHLDETAGMLFVFDQPKASRFWMKNTLIALDMIWIDEHFTIVDITHAAQPCKADPCPIYGPDWDVKYVLEINGGGAKEKGILVGEVVSIRGGD